MNHDHDEALGDYLTDHSNAGTIHLVEAAQHLLSARLMSEKRMHGLTAERVDTLAYEAWVTFISSSLYAYHTWVMGTAQDAVDSDALSALSAEAEDIIENHVRPDWERWVEAVKLVMLPLN